MKKIISILPLCLILCGCLTYEKYSFEFDFTDGRVEKTFYNIQSQKGFKEENYSPEQDWALLQSRIGEEFGDEFDPDVIQPVKSLLYQDGDVLSGKEMFKVQLPKAFPSKTAILELLHSDQNEDFKFHVVNDEIFMFAGKKKIEASNGRIIETEENNIIVWPVRQEQFEFTLIPHYGKGESLLPFFLEGQTKEPGQAQDE